ncbi:tellurite resistance TerB family protein [Actinomadura rugatobispora]|uniref:Tellurite resistance TerB family protein n=1 Tax=Actinomadura rugatobispora TaxID=1994 RepID=A0ABW1ABV0_9ACTN|nr:tellurite resistance TerB family protein [Actinomadura rugatobispora]
MALWNRLRESAHATRSRFTAGRNALRSAVFRDAAMAMCALVAAADGTAAAAGRQRAAALISTSELLANFEAGDLHWRFDDYLAKLTADFPFGKIGVLHDIGRVRGRPAEARAVIRLGVAVGWADGRLDGGEKAVIREACRAVGLSPADFDL